jgi:hypothetical protein
LFWNNIVFCFVFNSATVVFAFCFDRLDFDAFVAASFALASFVGALLMNL